MKERNINKIYFTWRMLKEKRKINENRKENMPKNGKSEPRNVNKVEESMEQKWADKSQDVKEHTKKSVKEFKELDGNLYKKNDERN